MVQKAFTQIYWCEYKCKLQYLNIIYCVRESKTYFTHYITFTNLQIPSTNKI